MIINRVLKANTANLYCVHMCKIFSSEMKIFFILFYARHSEDMCAKYGRSRMNDVHTICPADFVGLPAKIVWSTTFFSKKKAILYDFCISHCLANLGVST